MRIAVSNPDNIGDFILRQPMLEALHREGHEVVAIVRDFVEPIAGLLTPFAKVLRCAGNPYSPNFTLDTPLGREFVANLQDVNPDIFVVASYQYTQLEEQLAALLPKADCVGFSGELFQSRVNAVMPSCIRFATQVSVAHDVPELEKNQMLCSAILGRRVELGPPRLLSSERGLQLAAARIERLGLERGSFWAVCAGDQTDKRIKNWDHTAWAEMLHKLVERQDVRLLFVGVPEEHEATESIRKLMGASASRTATLTAEPMDLEILTGLLDLSAGYIGKDTGPMHMAAALGKPVVAVFGGGHWPRFVPAAVSGAVFTVGVPCTGCNWTCHLTRSRCVKDIPVDTVLEAAERTVSGRAQGFEVTVIQPEPMVGAAIVKESWERARSEFRRIEIERADFVQWHTDRLREIERLEQEINEAKLQSNGVAESTVERVLDLDSRTSDLEFQARSLALDNRRMREDTIAMMTRFHSFRERAARKIVENRQRLEALRSNLDTLRSNAEQADASAALNELNRVKRLLEERQVEVTVLRARLDSIDGEYANRISDQEKLMRRTGEQLRSALSLIPDLRSEFAELMDRFARLEAEHKEQCDRNVALHAAQEALQEDHAARGALIERLSRELQSVEADREARGVLIEKLDRDMTALSADHAARGALIDRITLELGKRDAALGDVYRQIDRIEADRAERLRLIENLSAQLSEIEADRAERGRQITELHQHIDRLRNELESVNNRYSFRLLRLLRLV